MFDDIKYPEVDPNKKSASQLWEERYQKTGYLYGKEPSDFLKSYVGFLSKGLALDVAMGEGRNAVYLAQQGFKVEGLDCSSQAIEKAKALALEKSVALEAKVQNLDFFLMPLMKFNTVVMTYYKPAVRFFSEIKRGLAAGGTVLIEGYTTEHYKLNSQNPLIDFDQCYKPNELLGLLKDLHIIYYKEMGEGSSHLVQAIAKKIHK
ncbi:MAG: class I SAM-dependent methyltransferase [Proteobacteria bacterium]|nr:class I SAM-dependent methyltransferase [Pseudomonadota bacterium]NDC23181.1 class I SAM-dependent methyltransferase [Pseudomonadota bacterium]NDD03356.1 class I SAM-dependent methyltransferase [Pseudomonadota bacterium]NDG26243.1 class I SAM-dependent methyltransferase [Pseudomonadota bacterium]